MINTYYLSKITNKILQQEINKVDFKDLFENTEYKGQETNTISLINSIKNSNINMNFQ